MSMAVTNVPQPGTLSASEVLDGIRAVRDVLAPDLSDSELRLFAMVANRSGLDPFAKQVYAVKRKGRVTFQTGIDGYRSTAERTGEYLGSDEPEYGPWVEKPYGHPEWSRVVVHRAGRNPQPATAYWDEFVPADGQDAMWRKMPRNQLAKCAEALALRKAFPFLLADVYTTEEMQQADSRDAAEARAAEVAAIPTARDRVAARRAALAPDVAPDPTPEPEEAAAAEEAAVEGEFREDPAPDPAACASTSPYDGAASCALAHGHKGNHRSAERETWS